MCVFGKFIMDCRSGCSQSSFCSRLVGVCMMYCFRIENIHIWQAGISETNRWINFISSHLISSRTRPRHPTRLFPCLSDAWLGSYHPSIHPSANPQFNVLRKAAVALSSDKIPMSSS